MNGYPFIHVLLHRTSRDTVLLIIMHIERRTKMKKQPLPSIGVALLCSVTFFLFGPMEIVMSGSDEFWFHARDILPMSLLYTAIAFAVIFCLTYFLSKKSAVIIGIFFGLGLALYVQGNYTFTDYGVMDGHPIDWSAFGAWPVIDTLLWVALIGGSVFLSLKKKELFKKIAVFASFGIVLVQLITLGTLLLTTDVAKNTSTAYISDEGLDDVSKEQNVVVLILDSFDDRFFHTILEEEPEYLSPLDGFTYFSNNTGMFPTTNGALPYILTGQPNDNEKPYTEYVKEAYENMGPYYDDLLNTGYTIGLYTTDTRYIPSEFGLRATVNYRSSGAIVSSPTGLSKTMYKITAFRYFPHLAKRFAWYYSGELDQWRVAGQDDAPAFSDDNLRYYQRLNERGLSVMEQGKIYKLIHLHGVHNPINQNENLEAVTDGSANAISMSKGALKIVYSYIEQLKKLDVYDQTTLVVMADHGEHNYSITNPLFLVKPQNARGDLQISNAPVCQGDLMATIMTDIGLNGDGKYGRSAFDWQEGEQRTREFRYYSLDNVRENDYLPKITLYRNSSGNNSVENFELVSFEAEDYTLGTLIPFGGETDIRTYFASGMSAVFDGDYAWSSGKSSLLILRLGDQATGDLTGEFTFMNIFGGSQELIIQCGETELFRGTISSTADPVLFTVPQSCIQDGILKLTLSYPNAISPAELGQSTDGRTLALGFSSFLFDLAEKMPMVPIPGVNPYTLGTPLSFAEGETANQYCVSGFSSNEGTHTWTEGTEALLRFDIDNMDKNLALYLDYDMVIGGSQTVRIYANDVFITEYVAEQAEEKEIIIPKDTIGEDGTLFVKLELPDADSPYNLGMSNDVRLLALMMRGIRLEQAN